jgi:hypothetical protein
VTHGDFFNGRVGSIVLGSVGRLGAIAFNDDSAGGE